MRKCERKVFFAISQHTHTQKKKKQNGRIALTPLSQFNRFFVCLCADKQTELGLLKVKAELIADQISKPLLDEWPENEEEMSNEGESEN